MGEMDQFAIYKLQLEKKLNEGIDETDGNNNSQKTEGQKAKNTNADSATAQMGITSQELKNQTVKAMKFASREMLPGVNVGIFSDEFFQEVYQKFLEEVKNGPHGGLDVQGLDVLPVLLQERHEEVHGQVDVLDELLLGHPDVADSHGQTEDLLHLELDGGLQVHDLGLQVVAVSDHP